MAKYNRRLSVTYPGDNDERTKDANKKLKAQIRNLQKIIKRLESENKTLNRAFNKSCDFIQQKLYDKNLKEIMDMIENFDYKETENGRIAERKKNKCPKCADYQNYKVMNFNKFKINICKCGHRERIDTHEGNERD